MDKKARIAKFVDISKSFWEEDKHADLFHNVCMLENENEEDIEKAKVLLNDLKSTPHAFVLGCVMDCQIKFERAWMIPYRVFSALLELGYIKNYSIDELAKVCLGKYEHVFNDHYSRCLHRYIKKAPLRFYKAVLLIKEKYASNAATIWTEGQSAGVVARRFKEFNGVSQKISTMAVKLLAGNMNVKFSCYNDLDIPIDRHVINVMRRLGLVPCSDKEGIFKKNIINETRNWNPEYPGIFDYACFKVGLEFCKRKHCVKCPLNEICDKNFGSR